VHGLGHARRRQQGGGRHTEEGHEGRVLGAEVHVRQVDEAGAFLDGPQHRPDAGLAVEQPGLAEAARALSRASSKTALLCRW
jgi:hypothetical protein